MISAKEAIQLPRARLTPEQAREAQDVLEDLDQYIRDHMTFAGIAGDSSPRFLCPGITVLGGITNVQRTTISSDAVAKAVCLKAARIGWTCQTQMMSVPNKFTGATPHHWVFTILPVAETYTDEDFPVPAPPKSRLLDS